MEPSNDTQSPIGHRLLEKAPAHNSPTRSPRQRPPVKLRCIHDSSKNNSNAGSKTKPIDIFAIHGLDTESKTTWIWKNKPNDPTEVGVDWLADDCMLPSRVGPSRIFTCDWPAELFESLESAEHTFQELAELLLEAMLGHYEEQRPILFIASCLGGIILMKALSIANGLYHPIQLNTRAIIFLSTPFRGTAFQKVAKWAEPGLKVWAKSQGRRVTVRLSFAKESNPEIAELVRKFTQILKDENYEVSTFYEKKYTNLHRKVPGFSFLLPSSKILLVNRESGTLDWDANPISLDRTHGQMNKFRGPKDTDYGFVASRIERSLAKVRAGTLLQRADACVVRHYAEERLKIVRLSGDALEMSQCYINLATVEQRKDKTGATSAQESPFALHNRLNLMASHEDLLVDLPTLFSPHESSSGDNKDPRRILIRGRAGVGKTTLCKKIVHNFIHENMWGNLFTRILWVPLRELKAPLPRYNLGDMFHHVYFKNQNDGQKFTEALWDTVQKTGYRDSLFILDGLDEISELLTSDHPAFSLLIELLNSPNVIITTRPYTQLPSNVKNCDRELETIGFDLDQVHNYISKVQNPQNAGAIWAFLQKHRLMQSLVRIPILLDALCFTWDENFRNNSISETMTAIYDAIVRRLWKRKDVLRLNKFFKGPISKAFDSEIEEKTKAEREILERLAFSGMYSNVVEFQPEQQDQIRKLLKPDTEGRLFDELLGSLSFLRFSDSLGNTHERSYHFLHLTFQEFFAAKYFVRQWQAGRELEFVDFKTGKELKITTDAFLRREKYTRHYDIVWRFTVGLLQLDGVQGDKEPDKGIGNFLEAIEREPIDLIGLSHQRLIMRCLSEANTWKSKLRSNLESRLSQWLVLQSDLHLDMLHLFISHEPEFPDGALLSALKTSTYIQKRIIVSLESSGRHLSEPIVAALMAIIADESSDDDIRFCVLGALRTQSNISEAISTELVKLIVNERTREDIRDAAATCLAAQSEYSEAAIIAVVDIKKGKLQGRSTITEAGILGKQLGSSESAIARLFGEKYTESYTELLATKALEIQYHLSEVAIAACIWLIENMSGMLPRYAFQAVKQQVELSENAITALVGSIGNGRMHYADDIDEVVDVLSRPPKLSDDNMTTLSRVLESKDSDFGTRAAVARLIRSRGGSPETFMKACLELIENEDASEDARTGAVKALLNQGELSESIIGALVMLIENDGNLQHDAGRVLSRQKNLSETAITTLLQLIGNETRNEQTRCFAIDALRKQENLSSDAITALISLIENEHGSQKIRDTAVRALSYRLTSPKEAIEPLIRLVENERESERIRSTALLIFSWERELSEDIIAMLLRVIEKEHEHEHVRHSIARTLRHQTNLPPTAIATLVRLIGNEHQNKPLRIEMIKTIGIQRNIPLVAVTALLRAMNNQNDYNRSERFEAAGILGNQTSLPNATSHDLVALRGTEGRAEIFDSLAWRSSALLDQLVRAVTSTLESGRTSEGPDFLKLWYECFLYLSFREQFCMCIEDGDLVIYLPSGPRIRVKGVPSDEVLAAINGGRRLIRSSSCRSSLWPNSGVDS